MQQKNQYPSEEAEKHQLAMAAYDRQLALTEYGYTSTKPSALLNSLFMNTVNTAAKTLVSVASNAKSTEKSSGKWKPSDHMRFMLMMMTWMAVWVLRVLMDHFPFSSSSPYLLDGISQLGNFDFLSAASSSSSSALSSILPSSAGLSSTLALFSSSAGVGVSSYSSSLDLVLGEDSSEVVSAKALGRALTNVSHLLHVCCYNPSLFHIYYLLLVIKRLLKGTLPIYFYLV